MTTHGVVELARELTEADKAAITAIGQAQGKWKSDPAGRRSRGAQQGAANRRRARAMARLIDAVRDPATPEIVRDHFQTNGPTYYDAARCAEILERLA